jgi:hypothetical protein
MVSRLLGNFHAEITHQSQEVITALGATGLVPIERYFGDKAAVLEQALANTPAFLLQVPQAFSPDRASDVIVEHLQEALRRAGVNDSGGSGGKSAMPTNGAASSTPIPAAGAKR